MTITKINFMNARSPFCTTDDLAAYTGKTKRYMRTIIAELKNIKTSMVITVSWVNENPAHQSFMLY